MANSAPTLDFSASPTFTSIAEGTMNSAGDLVSSLLGGTSDADGDTLGIAVLSVDNLQGTWQYSVDGGTTWLTINESLLETVTTQMGLLLGPTARLRLLHNTEYRGDSGIVFAAWDQTSGTQGSYVQVATRGGSTAFSTNADVAYLEVTGTNDAPTFSQTSGGGKNYYLPAGFLSGTSTGLMLQPDGKYLVGGSGYDGSNSHMTVQRLNSDGTLDTTFNSTGSQTVVFTANGVTAGRFATQADGKILVAGTIATGSIEQMAVARLNADGSFDTTFNGTGKVTIPLSASIGNVHAVIAQADGKVIVVGKQNNGTDLDMVVVRLLSDGSLDTSFNGTGKFILATSAHESIYAAAVQADGSIVLVGDSTASPAYADMAVLRLKPDGTLDTSFNATGMKTIALGPYGDHARGVVIQPDGKIIVTGHSQVNVSDLSQGLDFAVVRLNANGSLDTSFNGTGYATAALGAQFDLGADVALQADGKILAAGYSDYGTGTYQFDVVRWNANGTLDTTFNGTGKLTLPASSTYAETTAIVVAPDGKITISGSVFEGSQKYAVIRLNSDGSLDGAFNGTTTSTLDGIAAFTEGGSAVALDTSVAIFDQDMALSGDFGGASVTLARHGGASADDVFTPRGNLTFEPHPYVDTIGSVKLGGTQIGTYSKDPGTLTIYFIGGMSGVRQAGVNEALSSLAYSNTSDAPPASVQIDWTFSDGNSAGYQGAGGVLSATGSTTVNITGVNDPVSVSVPGAISAVSEEVKAVTGLSISDADGPAGGTFEVTLSATNGTLSASTLTGLTFTTGDGTADATMTFHGTLAAINTALATVSFTSDDGYEGAAEITLQATDTFGGVVASGTGAATSDSDTVTVTVTASNDPVTASAPAAVTVAEDASGAIAGLSIADADAADAPDGIYEVTLSATQGTATLSTLTGLAFTAGDGTADSTMTFHGKLADINAALATASYKANANFHGSAQVTLAVTDSYDGVVATGSGAATSDTENVAVTVTAVNDPVGTTAPGAVTVAEGSSTAVTGCSISDADAALDPAGAYEVVLSAGQGQLTLTTLTGLTFTEGDGTADASMTFHGTLADINAALATLGYAASGDFNGSDTITFSATDSFGGVVASGAGSATNDSDAIAVTVSAVNDPVSATAPAAVTVAEDASVAVTGLGIADVDAALATAGVYEVTLSAGNGTLSMSTLSGLTFTAGDGTGDAAMTFHGTLAAINTALTTTTYAGASNFNGSDSISFSVTDTFGEVVATGTGTATSDSKSIAVTVTAANDAVSASAPATVTLDEDSSVAVTGVSIADADATLAADGIYEVTLGASHGKLTMGTLTGLTFTAGDGTSDAGLKFKGTLASINAALATLGYAGDGNYNGGDTISYAVTDEAGAVVATGSGSGTSASGSIAVTVNAVNDPHGGSVSISGTARVGETLTASHTFTDIDGMGTVEYQWSAGGTPIGGAVGASYVVGDADAGKIISVTASFIDGGSTLESSTFAMASVAGSVVVPTGGSTLTGSAGDDVIVGGRARETMVGDAGDDTYIVGNGDKVVEAAGEGDDTVEASSTYVLTDNVENLVLTGTRNGNGTGNALDNEITGNAGTNKLTGGLGADVLTGGLGRDTFAYLSADDSTQAAWDVITDFSAAQGDKIDLKAIDADVVKGGNQKFIFIGTAQFSDFASGTALLRFDATTHMLQASVDADFDVEFQVELTGVTTLLAGNIGL